MGYYTKFTIKVIENPDNIDLDIIQNDLEEVSEYSFDELDYNELYIEAKWYNHHIDMQKLTEKYPTIVLQVDGSGEERGDIWRSYWKNGKTVLSEAKIIFPDYNETWLK